MDQNGSKWIKWIKLDFLKMIKYYKKTSKLPGRAIGISCVLQTFSMSFPPPLQFEPPYREGSPPILVCEQPICKINIKLIE